MPGVPSISRSATSLAYFRCNFFIAALHGALLVPSPSSWQVALSISLFCIGVYSVCPSLVKLTPGRSSLTTYITDLQVVKSMIGIPEGSEVVRGPTDEVSLIPLGARVWKNSQIHRDRSGWRVDWSSHRYCGRDSVSVSKKCTRRTQ